MIIDLHAHTSAISTCCRIPYEEVLTTARDHGFDGLAIANHYTRGYYTPDSYGDFIERYIAEWNSCERLGRELGLRIFKAVEVTMEYEPRLHMLVYGANERFLRENPRLCELSHRELYEICVANNCALVQAHPFRGGATVQDTALLHGVEVNCHPMYKNSFAEEVIVAAREARLAVTVGCDYHADTYRPEGGTYVPGSVESDAELAKWLLTSGEFALKIHEPSDNRIYELTYTR